MRPHRLRMTAFGPFAETVEVDLDALAASGLFLLQGETGAGKTTLLDGLGFALYGRVPGVRGRTGRLRSDHAAPGLRTEVELEVTLGGRRWRITRSPAQERPKARGTGTTTEQARVLLEVQEGEGWRAVSTRLDEAALELDPLLGMSADQFFQVVLLPQGEFARFLRAESKERGLLLQRLFATERFQAVEDWLAARRVAAAGAVGAARQDLRVLTARLAQAAAVEPPLSDDGASGVPGGLPVGVDPPGDGVAAGGLPAPVAAPVSLAVWVAPWAAGVVRAADEERARAQADATAATLARDAARATSAAAVRLGERQDRRRTALATRAALRSEQPAYDRLVAELQAADRAAALAPVLQDSAARRTAGQTSALAAAAARARLLDVGLTADLPVAAVRQAAEAARTRSGRLAGLRGVADELAGEQALLARCAAEAAQHRAVAERWAGELMLLPARRDALHADLTAARAAAERLAQERATADRLEAALGEATGLVATEQLRADLRSEHLLAREGLVGLREKEAELRESRLTSMVAELAGQLEEGAPCEVCGSVEHPDPYEGTSEGVSREDEDRARWASEAAARELADVEARAAAATAVAEGQRARLAAAGLGTGVEQLRTAVAAARTAVSGSAAVAQRLPATVQRAADLDAEQVESQAELTRARADGTVAARRQADTVARAAHLADRLAAELAGAPDLDAALAACAGVVACCDAVVRADEQAERDAAEVARADRAAVQAAGAAGFPSPDQARAALRAADWVGPATARRAEHERRRAAVEAALLDPDLDVDLDQPAGVAPAVDALHAADALLGEAVGALAAAEGRCRELAVLAPAVLVAAEALVTLEERAALVKRLADLCAGGGGNALRMTLTSFVLAARLEEVAAAATGRLLRMTQGRYALVHTDGAAKGGARSGLGLLVRDSWTGRERETSTLSGGETFLASLALALGLADVVQAEAGGTRIEALFVDEGFGTLDEQTLDEVMDVLDALREGGRLVGLVSHVPELKARIPAQVQVRKTRTGSTVRTSGC